MTGLSPLYGPRRQRPDSERLRLGAACDAARGGSSFTLWSLLVALRARDPSSQARAEELSLCAGVLARELRLADPEEDERLGQRALELCFRYPDQRRTPGLRQLTTGLIDRLLLCEPVAELAERAIAMNAIAGNVVCPVGSRDPGSLWHVRALGKDDDLTICGRVRDRGWSPARKLLAAGRINCSRCRSLWQSGPSSEHPLTAMQVSVGTLDELSVIKGQIRPKLRRLLLTELAEEAPPRFALLAEQSGSCLWSGWCERFAARLADERDSAWAMVCGQTGKQVPLPRPERDAVRERLSRCGRGPLPQLFQELASIVNGQQG